MNKSYLFAGALALMALISACSNPQNPNSQPAPAPLANPAPAANKAPAPAAAKPLSPVRQLIVQAIDSAGQSSLANANISFDFRNIQYGYFKQAGQYTYSRLFMDSTGSQVQDVLTNKGLERYTNGQPTPLPDTLAAKYAESVNSVIYFALLPRFLTDGAVQASLQDTITIKGQTYYQVQVNFGQQDGGTDFDDVFLYWFNTSNLHMDYLAYQYNRDGGGIRFRQAFNTRRINGLLMQDYYNFKPAIKGSLTLAQLPQAFEANELKLLSEIALETVRVEMLDAPPAAAQ